MFSMVGLTVKASLVEGTVNAIDKVTSVVEVLVVVEVSNMDLVV